MVGHNNATSNIIITYVLFSNFYIVLSCFLYFRGSFHLFSRSCETEKMLITSCGKNQNADFGLGFRWMVNVVYDPLCTEVLVRYWGIFFWSGMQEIVIVVYLWGSGCCDKCSHLSRRWWTDRAGKSANQQQRGQRALKRRLDQRPTWIRECCYRLTPEQTCMQQKWSTLGGIYTLIHNHRLNQEQGCCCLG